MLNFTRNLEILNLVKKKTEITYLYYILHRIHISNIEITNNESIIQKKRNRTMSVSTDN